MSFSLKRERAERIFTLLHELLWPPPEALGLFDNQDGSWRIDVYFRHEPDRAALSNLLAERGAGKIHLSIEAVPDIDWVSFSQAELGPVRAGRFLVHGSHNRERATSSRWAIEIEAAQAFGTAHHGSTFGCLLELDRLAKQRRFKRVLDLGTGTGVLAIAAARLWRALVVASDIEPVAVQIARSNARRNRVGELVHTVRAAGTVHPVIRRAAPYDLVVANILAQPLTGMARDIARMLRPGGVAVLSGITCDQANSVTAAFTSAGLVRCRRAVIGDWVTLVLTLHGRAHRTGPATGR